MQRIARALATRARIVRRSAAGESICALVEGSRSLSARPVCGGDAMRAMAWTVCRTGRALRVLDGSASAKEQAVVSATLRKSKAATDWRARRLARSWLVLGHGASQNGRSTACSRTGYTLKFSQNPEFDSKLADIVGLYLAPPERAVGAVRA